MKTKNKIIKILLFLLVIIVVPSNAFAQTVDPSFNPSKLIEDKVFIDTQTFGGAEGVQRFLEIKNSVLSNTSPEFLVKLKEPIATIF